MSNLSQFIGGSRPPKTIVNSSSSGTLLSSIGVSGAKSIASGATTADVLKTMLSISGAGAVKFLCLTKVDTTPRTIRLKVTIDGVTVFDATSASDTNANYGLLAVGSSIDSAWPQLDSVAFNSSLLVEAASSVASETDKLTLYTIYETR